APAQRPAPMATAAPAPPILAKDALAVSRPATPVVAAPTDSAGKKALAVIGTLLLGAGLAGMILDMAGFAALHALPPMVTLIGLPALALAGAVAGYMGRRAH